MGDKTAIEWTDATWNPLRGCSRVSEGCRNCYAERVAARFSGKGQAYEGLAVMKDTGPHWTGEVRLVEEHLADPLRWKRPRRIFVNSMSDLFHESVPDEWIDRIFAVMAYAKQHTFQVLTKRPGRMAEYFGFVTERRREGMRDFYRGLMAGMTSRDKPREAPRITKWPLPNVWLGVSVENQKTADERIPLLLRTPAAVRFVSAEPLLGPVDLWEAGMKINGRLNARTGERAFLDWVIVGGESGSCSRPMHPDWARSLRDQCEAAGVAFFFKQWGNWFPSGEKPPADAHWEIGRDKALSHIHLWQDEGKNVSFLVGKGNAGRLLDGRTWDEMPAAAAPA
jgi:protein gp37